MFSAKTVEFGEKILHHQLWFFGKDILHEEGNLLIRYGFEKFGVPDGKTGGNSYRLVLNDTQEIALFGFGIFFGNQNLGGIFSSDTNLSRIYFLSQNCNFQFGKVICCQLGSCPKILKKLNKPIC